MKVLADLTVVPLGVGVSLSPYVAACERILNEAGLHTAAARLRHERRRRVGRGLRRDQALPRGAARDGRAARHDQLQVGTRTDRDQTLEDKSAACESKLGESR